MLYCFFGATKNKVKLLPFFIFFLNFITTGFFLFFILNIFIFYMRYLYFSPYKFFQFKLFLYHHLLYLQQLTPKILMETNYNG